MTFMILALVVVVVSLIVILIHAEGKWLNNFDVGIILSYTMNCVSSKIVA